MAKNKSKRVKAKPAGKRKRRAAVRVAGGGKAKELANLLLDPCGAPASGGIYPGENGMVERFISEATIVGAANTAAYLAFHPNTGWIQFSNVATSSGASSSSFQTSNAPGQSFLTTNGQKVRGLGACIQAVCSTLSITAITGEIAMGVMSADTLQNNGTISVDTLFSVLQARSALTRETKDVKWFPGSMDNRYATYVNGSTNPTWLTTGADFSDTNIVVVAIRNVPSGTSINLRITWVCEWTPKPLLGLVPHATTSGGVNHLDVVSALHNTHPSWWHNLGSSLGHMAGVFGNQAMQAIGQQAKGGLTRFVQGAGRSLMRDIGSAIPLLL